MSLFEPGDTVMQTDIFPAVTGIVCRVFDDGGVQAFFAEGPHMDSFTCNVYPPGWLTRINAPDRARP